MPNVIPAPIPPATATASGVVSTGAQTLGAGQKTFSQPGINTPSIVLPGGAGGFGYGGGLQIGSGFNAVQNEGTGFYLQSYGSGNPAELRSFQTFAIVSGRMEGTIAAGEIAVKIGTRRPDANVDVASKLASFRTGIAQGGSESEKAWITGTGGIAGTGTPGTSGGNLTPGQGWALGSYNVNIGSAALWLGTSNPALTDYTLATSSSGGLSTPVGTTLRGSAIHIRGGNGTVSGDKIVSLGTTQADGSVNAGAKILSLATGLGGTEVEHVYFQKGSGLVVDSKGVANVPSFQAANAGLGVSGFAYGMSAGGSASWGNTGGYSSIGVVNTNRTMHFVVNGSAYDASVQAFYFRNQSANAALTVLRLGAALTQTGHWLEVGEVGSVVARVAASGRIDLSGTDSSGTPGAATINKPSGVSAIAGGATTVTITNSLVTASSRVRIDWYGDLGTQTKQPWITRAAGSFTVNVGTAPAGAVAFGWEVSSLI